MYKEESDNLLIDFYLFRIPLCHINELFIIQHLIQKNEPMQLFSSLLIQ